MKTIITLFCMCFSLVAFSQTTVTGNVVDESQEPTLGANITVMGVAIGTSTDYDGNFTLTGDKIPTQLKVGDRVVLPTQGFTKLPFNGEEYLVGP